MSSESRVLVYVQARPLSIPSFARRFQDIETSEFVMGHSSKVALDFAGSIGTGNIVAAGFSPVLTEALARGATSAWTMPLCDDPLEQVSFFPKDTPSYSQIIVGESPDWVFSGSSICGVMAGKYGFSMELASSNKSETGARNAFQKKSVILVRDSGVSPATIDIRRIKPATEVAINPDGVLGGSSISKIEPKRPEVLKGNARELATALKRKIRRIVRE